MHGVGAGADDGTPLSNGYSILAELFSEKANGGFTLFIWYSFDMGEAFI